MTAILGISAFYHDAAAALVVDGEIVAAAQEERFTRKKHDERFPEHAVAYCLKEAGLTAEDVDYVGFYEKPYLTFERLLETYLAFAPAGFPSFVRALPVWMREKLHVPRLIRKGLGGAYKKRIVFTEHHESHAASAFYPSPFEEAAVLTLDGVGEWATASIGHGRGHQLELVRELRFPHSIGLLYSAFTYFTGFKVNSGEYKLMGLAPYGEPIYADVILDKLIDLKPDGSFRVDLSYFAYCQGLTMTSPRMNGLFGGPPRTPETPITQREMDLAASIQQVTEEIMLRCARTAHEVTGSKNLCMAGGVALNCVANGRILREGPFDQVWIQPAAGDAGGALGVALFTWHQLLGKPRTPNPLDAQSASMLGPRFGDSEIRAFLDGIGAVYQHFDCTDGDDALCDHVAGVLADEKVVGWMQGRMEFGPRALGGRSILGDPRSQAMQSVMNLKIKFRESFRPFAPSILEEYVDEYFEMRPREQSQYMLLVADVKPDKRIAAEAGALTGLDKLKLPRSVVPAITHVDYSARVQTVDAARHGRYHGLLAAFNQRTGCPLVVNTSFNVRSEPIVCTPEDAYRCFMATNMDVLVIEGFVLAKDRQPEAQQHEVNGYLAQFELD
jgi:carbamoyltransferase